MCPIVSNKSANNAGKQNTLFVTEVTIWDKMKEELVDSGIQTAEYHLRCRLQRSEFSFSACYSTGDVHFQIQRGIKKTV
jgi:hypothetical protein